MADYAYIDKNRTEIIYASNPDILQYRKQRMFCRNSDCNARLFIHRPDVPQDAYFQAHGEPSHNGVCGIPSIQHFNRAIFNEDEFLMPDAIINLIEHNDNVQNDNDIASHNNKPNDIIANVIHPPRTLLQIYTMCVNISPDDTYNNIPIRDILVSKETLMYYTNGINGYRILECSHYKYNRNTKTITVNYPYVHYERNIELWFDDNTLYRYVLERVINLGHSHIILIAGEFHTDDNNNCYTRIKSKRQLHIL